MKIHKRMNAASPNTYERSFDQLQIGILSPNAACVDTLTVFKLPTSNVEATAVTDGSKGPEKILKNGR